MKKKIEKKNRLPAGVTEALAAFGLILAVILLVVLFRPPEQPPQAPVQTTAATTTAAEQFVRLEVDGLPLSLGGGISLTGLYAADAVFPEDGSSRPVENVLCAVVRNDSGKTLEYMTFTLQCGEELREFSVTTLPASREAYVFEKNAAQAPQTTAELKAESQIQLFFDEEPQLMEDQLRITVRNGSIEVCNISDAAIKHEIQVYYKNTRANAYFGGITYFLRIPEGLAEGETYNAYAAHADVDRSEVMFVKYGN